MTPRRASAPPQPSRRLGRRRSAAILAASLAAVGLVAAGTSSAGASASRPSVARAADSPAAAPRHLPPGGVIANLWEWNWPSVGRECRTVLGPKGYGGVQVAPPQDSLSRTEAVDPDILHPWWEVYQPVDYRLTSRMGNAVQFKHMVSACRHAGVKVYVDAVINHMTGQGDTSYGGVSYSKYHYTGIYDSGDFHHAPADCPSASGNIDDFNNYTQVVKCELVSLSDLRTESTYVRDRLARYLNRLIRYGVSGFRVDAAKHVGHVDLAAIRSRLHRTVDGTRPYVALEVFPGGPGKISPWAFRPQGDLLGFDAAYQIHDAFKSYTAEGVGDITTLKVFGQGSGLLPSKKSLTLVENHDTERGTTTLSYKDGDTNLLATEFLLAAGYGRPTVYSSFEFTGNDDSPPATADGFITNTRCGTGWTCVDRNTGVANMVGWHNHVRGADRANWYDDGVNLIAFSRGHKGWIAINNNTTAKTRKFATGLAAGTYCDIIHGNDVGGACSGPTVTVNSHGKATVTVGAKDSVAFDRTDLVS